MNQAVVDAWTLWTTSRDPALSNAWPFRPRPRPDELLSSWFLRAAHGLELKPYALSHMLWRSNPPVLTRDIDNMGDARVVGAMAAKTGTSPLRAWQTTLPALEGHLTEAYFPGARNSWVMPVGVRHRARNRPGLQYCPLCLAHSPYFRRAWRLAFVTTCTLHERRLLDRCPDCFFPLEPHRSAALHLCARCQRDLRSGSSYAASPRVLVLQRRMEQALGRGWASLGGVTLPYAHLYFGTVRMVAKALARGQRAQAMRDIVARRFGGDPTPFEFQGLKDLETLEVAERHRLMDLTAALLIAWPHRLVEVCRQARVWRSWILRDVAHVPFAMARVVDDNLGAGVYQPSEIEIRAALAHLRRTRDRVTKEDLRHLVGDCDLVGAVFREDARRLFGEEALALLGNGPGERS